VPVEWTEQVGKARLFATVEQAEKTAFMKALSLKYKGIGKLFIMRLKGKTPIKVRRMFPKKVNRGRWPNWTKRREAHEEH
jgi:hypothetical protein